MIRLFNRLLAMLFGLALAGGGLLVIIEAIWTWSNSGFVWISGDQWLSTFKTTPWSAPIVIGISAGVASFGLLLLVLQIRPQGKRFLLYTTDKAGDWLLLRRSTEGHLQRRIASEVPTSPIRARLKPGVTRWTLRVRARADTSTRPELERAGRAELATLHAPESSRVLVRTSGATRRSRAG